MSFSKIGQQPILLPEGVSVVEESGVIQVSGPKAKLSIPLPSQIKLEIKNNTLSLISRSNSKLDKSVYGSTRAHLANLVSGVVTPWVKNLEINGTGYKFNVSGNKLTVTAGYINPVILDIPEQVTAQTTEETKLSLSSADKQILGQFASNIRKIKKPEPYKGKGIRYAGEFIKLKAGKAAKTTTA